MIRPTASLETCAALYRSALESGSLAATENAVASAARHGYTPSQLRAAVPVCITEGAALSCAGGYARPQTPTRGGASRF